MMPHRDASQECLIEIPHGVIHTPQRHGKKYWQSRHSEAKTSHAEDNTVLVHVTGHMILEKGCSFSMQVVGGHSQIDSNTTIKLAQQTMDKWLTAS